MAEVFNVADYGSIQAAIDAAPAGSIIQIDAGTYDLYTPLHITKNLTFQGANAAADGNGPRAAETILQGGAGSIFDVASGVNVSFDGFKIVGDHVIDEGNVTFSLTNSVLNITATQDNVFYIGYEGGNNFTFSNNYVEAEGYTEFLALFGDGSATVANNTFVGIGSGTVDAGGGNDVPDFVNVVGGSATVTNNAFTGGDIGVLVHLNAGPVEITGNTFEDMHRLPGNGQAAGVVFVNLQNPGLTTIEGNTFTDLDAGIRTSNIPGTTIAGKPISIDGNTFDNVSDPLLVTSLVTGSFSPANSYIVVYDAAQRNAAVADAGPTDVIHTIGTAANETVTGRDGGPDWFTGGDGDDTFYGGVGDGDRFVYDHANAGDITGITKIGQNVFITTSEGTDGLNGVEEIQFANGDVISVSGTNLVVDTAADTNDAEEDGLAVSGNVLGNDHDIDNSPLTIQGIAAGDSTTPVTGGIDAPIAGTYGTLTIAADGGYSYTANDADVLAEGETDTDTFTYTVNDNGTLVTETITITVTGTNDAPIVTNGPVVGKVFEAGDADTFVNASWDSAAVRPESNYVPTPAIAAALAGLIGDENTAGGSVDAVLNLITADLFPSGGTRADAILAVWDYLDTFYTSAVPPATNYYHLGHNTATIRLGLEYIEYLKAGNAPLTGVIVK
jgi:VCBS repeat-containing protein